ncbi:WecB/TagA/CpsF family glycosyltransferase [Actinoplanes sp. NPDC026670]|uniref:WecB/TagA/CpsF family glycosyltransferase n=1 Tax=Actinoplanes sp. NPDC026670 TaxID=3154700 RepID=UPI0033F3ED19
MAIEAFERVHLDGTGIDRITEDEVVAVVRESLAHGRGGRIITPNVDILRRAAADPGVRRHLDDADLIVADGMPLVWASRLGGVPLPERVAGSSLIWSLSEGLGRDARSVFVIGGTPAAGRPRAALSAAGRPQAALSAAGRAADARPERRSAEEAPAAATDATRSRPGAILRSSGTPVSRNSTRSRRGDRPVVTSAAVKAAISAAAVAKAARIAGKDGAARAAARLVDAYPALRIAGTLSPDFGFEEDEATYADFCAAVVAARPDLVFVGLGFPKQELVIERLRPELPGTWFVGCGAAVNFVAGDIGRAPRWMQRTGLEWAHRLGTEPRRLAGRYLRHDAPYTLRLLARAPRRRPLRPDAGLAGRRL